MIAIVRLLLVLFVIQSAYLLSEKKSHRGTDKSKEWRSHIVCYLLAVVSCLVLVSMAINFSCCDLPRALPDFSLSAHTPKHHTTFCMMQMKKKNNVKKRTMQISRYFISQREMIFLYLFITNFAALHFIALLSYLIKCKWLIAV